MPLKIVFVIPPAPYLFVKTHYPIGPAILAGKLQKAGHHVTGCVVNSLLETRIPPADWYLFSSSTPSYPYALSLAKQLRLERPKARLAIGGPHSSALPEEVLADEVWDYVVAGEADDVIVPLVEGHFDRGIIRCAVPQNIDQIPLRKIFPPPLLKVGGRRAANVMFTRGCPFRCRFCASGGIKHRWRSEESVMAELAMLRQDGYSAVVLNDDTPILNDEHLERLCRIMKSSGMLFRMNLRADQVTEPRARLLHESGCVQVNIGVEAASDSILANIDKRTSVEESIRAFDILHRVGLKTKALLIFGLPGMGEKEAWEMVEFVNRTRPTYVTLTSFFPMPGSPYFFEMREWFEAQGFSMFDFLYHGKDGNSRDGIHHLPNGVLTSEELDSLKKKIWDAIENLGVKIDRGEASLFNHRASESEVQSGFGGDHQ